MVKEKSRFVTGNHAIYWATKNGDGLLGKSATT